MKSVDLNIKSVTVESKTRVLKSEWSREMAKDILFTGSFDLEDFEKSIISEIKRSKIKNKINNIFSKHDTQY